MKNEIYAVVKTTFKTGETSYNLNRVVNHGSQADRFLKAVDYRIRLDIRDGKALNRLQQFFLEGAIQSCEVVQIFDDIVMAKRLVNLNCDTDPYNIRRQRFAIN
jgi:hypothetical protein